MSEYIIDTEKINELNRGNVTSWLSPYAISDTSVFPPRIKETHFAVTLPGIVRCRDCRFSLAHGNGCGRNQDIYDVEPNGFCALGERRES